VLFSLDAYKGIEGELTIQKYQPSESQVRKYAKVATQVRFKLKKAAMLLQEQE
jgi:hypothetical protein